MAYFANRRTFFSLCLLSFFFSISSSAKEIAISARGYCGDGILNGNEECDGNDLNFTDCSVLQGGSGKLSCQDNCIYDISDCSSISEASLISEIDRRIGGLAEACRCNCDPEDCSGGCVSNESGKATCDFDCDNQCICRCEGKIETHIEECNVDCSCNIDTNGNPDCSCSLSRCDLVTAISPIIGSLTSPNYSRPILPSLPMLPPVLFPTPVPVPGLPNGICGDGIINGSEQCDQSSIPTPHCSDIGGSFGIVTCQPNCTLDISDCIRAAQ